jgi:hypothetical protein
MSKPWRVYGVEFGVGVEVGFGECLVRCFFASRSQILVSQLALSCKAGTIVGMKEGIPGPCPNIRNAGDILQRDRPINRSADNVDEEFMLRVEAVHRRQYNISHYY